MKKIIVYFVAFIAIQIITSLVITVLASVVAAMPAPNSATGIIAASSISSLLAVIIFAAAKWHPFSLGYLKSRPWTVLYFCIVLALGMLIPSQFLEELIPESLTKDIMGDVFKTIMQTPWGFLAIALMAPLSEEVVFRGAIQHQAVKYFGKRFSKKKNNHWYGIIFTSLLFAIVHGNPAQMPHAFLIGMLMGWICYRTGSIVPGIVIHFVNNSTAFLIGWLYPQSYDMKLIQFFGDSYVRLSLAILFSLLLFLPALYQIHKQTKCNEN